MPSLFLNKHFKIIIYISFACVCVFEALFIHRYIEKLSRLWYDYVAADSTGSKCLLHF